MQVFISHISEEQPLAVALNEWIEQCFPDDVKVFVSSDRDDIPAGKDWYARIMEALRDADLVVVVCSPTSIARPWVNFEAGGAAVNEKRIIPLLHSGLTPGELPAPLNRFHVVSIDQDDCAERILGSIHEFRRGGKLPKFDFVGMRRALLDATRRGKATTRPEPKAELVGALPEAHVKILTLLARQRAAGEDEGWTFRLIAEATKLDPNDVEIELDELLTRSLVDDFWDSDEGRTYRVTTDGLRALRNLQKQ